MHPHAHRFGGLFEHFAGELPIAVSEPLPHVDVCRNDYAAFRRY